MSTGSRGISDWAALALLLLAALPLKLWLLTVRWINPDEGAHLMGGVLTLDGLIPGLDYGARQPFYVYATAAVFRFLPVGFASGRVLALVSTLGAAVLIFLIGREIFDRAVGRLAAALFLFLPFPLFLTVHAKTEPFAILLACGAIFCGIRAVRASSGAGWLYLAAGSLAGLGYYVRQSSLAVLLALGLILIVAHRFELKRLLRASGWIGAGFVGTCVLVISLYARHAPLTEVLSWQFVNPAAFVFGNVGDLAGAVDQRLDAGGALTAAPAAQDRVGGDQPFGETVRNVRSAVRSNVLVLSGAVLFPLLLLFGGGTPRGQGLSSPGRAGAARDVSATLILWAWTGALSAAYALWSVRSGFYQAYLLEMLPPLTLLAAALALRSWRLLPRTEGWGRTVGALLLVLVVLLGLPAAMGISRLPSPVYFFVPVALLGFFHLPRTATRGRWVLGVSGLAVLFVLSVVGGPRLAGPIALGFYGMLVVGTFLLLFWAAGVSWARQRLAGASFVSLTVIVAAFALTLADSPSPIGVAWTGIWAPETVTRVAEEIRTRTSPDAEVVSGAVIWELQAGRRPFMNVSHPLSLWGGVRAEVAPPILQRFGSAPPAVVVLDGYTERTYLDAVPELWEILERSYQRTLRLEEGTRESVEVYVLHELLTGGGEP